MIDPNVFAELQNRGIITNVGLKAEDYKDIDDLQRYGLATSIAADQVYDTIIEELVDMSAAKAAFLDAIKNGGKVVVDMDYTLDAPIEITKNVELDLNGHTLKSLVWDEDGDSNSYVFWVKSGTLTIIGDGEVVASDATYSMAVWVNGGNVVINGGTYKNGGDSCDLVYASKKGDVTINAGTFVAAGPASGTVPGTKNPYSAINVKDANRTTCKVAVKGGKFFMFDPANNVSEGTNTNFVAEGFTSVAMDNWFVVRESEIVVDDQGE